MAVLISDKLAPVAAEVFAAHGIEVDSKPGLTPEELLEIIGDYEGLAIRSATKVTAGVIAAAKRLKVIGRAGIGVDNVDIPAATAKGVVVMNTPFGNSITTAEHAIALMLAAARSITAADASTQAGRWEKNRFVGVELYAKTLGLIGCGNIGSIVADRALGLKLKVVTFDPYLTPERAVRLGVEKVELDELLARADVISLHVPMTDATRNILSEDALARTRRGVIIVNAARGGLVDEHALRRQLDSGHIGAAAFDVFSTEPAKENVLFGAPNFIATPHLGASTVEAQENVARQIAEQMSAYLLSGAVENALNMPSISAEEAPRLKPFVELAEKLGMFAGQTVDFGYDGVEIVLEGRVAAMNTKPLVAAALAGILRPQLEDVNMVSAPAVVRERGIELLESRRETSPVYDSLIRIRTRAGGEWRALAGSVIGGRPKIVEVDGMALQADFEPVMLVTRNEDRPGYVGALGTLLGNAGINIGTMQLGRKVATRQAIAIVGVDGPVPETLLAELRSLALVTDAKVLRF